MWKFKNNKYGHKMSTFFLLQSDPKISNTYISLALVWGRLLCLGFSPHICLTRAGQRGLCLITLHPSISSVCQTSSPALLPALLLSSPHKTTPGRRGHICTHIYIYTYTHAFTQQQQQSVRNTKYALTNNKTDLTSRKSHHIIYFPPRHSFLFSIFRSFLSCLALK